MLKAKKKNKGGDDFDDAPEAVHREQESMDGGIPKLVQNVLTHSSMAIFEMIENGLITSSSLSMEASANVQVFYIENVGELQGAHVSPKQWPRNLTSMGSTGSCRDGARIPAMVGRMFCAARKILPSNGS